MHVSGWVVYTVNHIQLVVLTYCKVILLMRSILLLRIQKSLKQSSSEQLGSFYS